MGRFRAFVASGVLIGVVVCAGTAPALGQTLADVARAEEARRKTAPKAAKTYTNQDLRPDPRSEQAPAPPPPASGASTAPEQAPPPAAEGARKEPEPAQRKDEQYWRTRITEARERLQRTKLFAEALQSRVNALTTDFVNRDDPAQRAVLGQERQRALDELARVQKETEEFTKAIADIEEEARRAGVPPGWLR